MLISELKGWHYMVSWDNPVPANSSSMLTSLKKLGRVTEIQTKTTIALSPRSSTGWRDVRSAIVNNLNPKKGNAIYVNIKSGKTFQYGKGTKYKWKKVAGN